MLDIVNKTRGKHPRLPFLEIKNTVLGKNYALSLVFIGSKRSRALNKRYRKKDYPANVLAFQLSEDEGEMFIDLAEARKEAQAFHTSYVKFTGMLFVHGLFHLKGYDHGSTMEKKESEIRKKFGI